MYVSLRYRFSTIVQDCIDILDDMAPAVRSTAAKASVGRSKTPTTRAQVSSAASSPSLRSRTPVMVDSSDHFSSIPPGGNVKVVVRVRGFLPRGR